ncbi:hypothetical protein M427DRAFT_51976 [Gonapodya prolifera JEL478]|uniref:N-terminal of MaoC-like dehydratase domain-containing protein n=1 Tax=Gonapodya prolifera (strain JEL478) TaxID=1344416 RepID=A0A139AWT3_GONPJ|nr:hypothetical protein M427DRAFT_51976 [Gonapodya prolifera JEL478]|eukprot:KXS21043.1 hypothetical protein M427DRAFT_51976 [Gonapodya prolifera JEL478]
MASSTRSTSHPATARVRLLAHHFTSSAPAPSDDNEVALAKKWTKDVVGKRTAVEATLDPSWANLLAATLAGPGEPSREFKVGDELPSFWHIIYHHHPAPLQTDLASSGHDLRLSPPTPPFSRRMWAGGSVEFDPAHPLIVGGVARAETWISKGEAKVGRKSGRMVAVVEAREVSMVPEKRGLLSGFFVGAAPAPSGSGSGSGPWSVKELRDVVYLKETDEGSGAKAAPPATPKPTFSRTVTLNEIDLFRLSALIFNANRVHYDHPYAHAAGHPDLVVAGPHVSLLLLDTVSRMAPARKVVKWSYRALSPLYVNRPMSLNVAPSSGGNGRVFDVWAADAEGRVGMKGQTELAE